MSRPQWVAKEPAVDQTIVEILLILAAVKVVFISGILWMVFKREIKDWWRERQARKLPPAIPICLYCQSTWTQAVDEGQSRWDGEDLVLVTTYECQHCRLPFWHVERVKTGALKP